MMFVEDLFHIFMRISYIFSVKYPTHLHFPSGSPCTPSLSMFLRFLYTVTCISIYDWVIIHHVSLLHSAYSLVTWNLDCFYILQVWWCLVCSYFYINLSFSFLMYFTLSFSSSSDSACCLCFCLRMIIRSPTYHMLEK